MKKELKVVVNQVPGSIEFNYEEIKENLATQMELYKDIQLTEETSAEGKKDIATLRKIKKAIDDKRIEVKKDCLKPYTGFEKKANELVALIDDPIQLIDKQVKVFEEKKRIEKKEKIRTAYDELIGDVGDYLPFEKIYDSKWENVSATMKSIKESLNEVISSTEMALKTITEMNSEAVSEALKMYQKNLSLTDAISYINRYEQQKAAILRKEEEKRKAEEERKRITEENRLRELERQRILEEERKRIAEENRIREEERARAAAEAKAAAAEAKATEETKAVGTKEDPNIPSFDTDGALVANDIEDPFPPMEDNLEDAFPIEDDLEEEFITDELPFVTPRDVVIKATFVIEGDPFDIAMIESFIKEHGVEFERIDE